MAVVEYCDYGNIRDLLRYNKDNFINDIDSIASISTSTNERDSTVHEIDDEQDQQVSTTFLRRNIPF